MNKKIAVFLPVGYRGSSLRGTKNILKMLSQVSIHEKFDIVFSCISNFYDIKFEFSEIIDLGVEIRETSWKEVSKEDVEITLNYLQCEKELKYPKYFLPTDGIKNFMDCDFWFLVSDRLEFPLAPVKPYSVVVYDYIQRYVPEILSKFSKDKDIPYIQTARNADVVLCTTPQTCIDAIQYAGVSDKKCILVPMEFDTLNFILTEYFEDEFDYIIWPTNATQHKNHLKALEAIEIYLNEYSGKLKIVLTGGQTNLFKKESGSEILYVVEVINKINKNKLLIKNILILGELDDKEYISVLAKAKFLFHPALYDNGTFAVIEAAYHNVPAISSDYPQMKFINDRFSLNMTFFNALNPQGIAKVLKEGENNHIEMKKNLPSKNSLEKFSPSGIADEYWNILRDYI